MIECLNKLTRKLNKTKAELFCKFVRLIHFGKQVFKKEYHRDPAEVI